LLDYDFLKTVFQGLPIFLGIHPEMLSHDRDSEFLIGFEIAHALDEALEKSQQRIAPLSDILPSGDHSLLRIGNAQLRHIEDRMESRPLRCAAERRNECAREGAALAR